jgi:NAD(P)-dependent dehydrogenase (short-subunit alcohol dehydrogenase family)
MTDTSLPAEKILAGRIALVTGASRGIGRAVALELARRGAHVIALARTQGGLEELDDAIRAEGGEATLVPCDVKDFAALDRLGAAIHERWGKLDILIGNAGILGPLTPISHCDPDKWEQVFSVNVTANYRLLRSLDPLLRASDAGRVVLISSGAAQVGDMRAFWALRRVEGRAGCDFADLCGRDGECLEHPRHERQSRPAAHQDARRRHAGRRPDELAHAGGLRAQGRRSLRAAMDRDRQDLRFPQGPGVAVSRGGLTA